MHLDVVDLRSFYYSTKLGRMAQSLLQSALRRLWPDTRGMVVAGFGFAAPFLRPFLKDAERVLCLMPGQQGVMPWPAGEPNRSTLVEETSWPLAAGTVDRLIVAHGLETCALADELLDEIHRVLAPDGRVVFIVPNRAGIWARRDATPFGYGRPYSV
ncbi:MAG: methyltransferase domain-containing protein, partial [Pseudomonadota bacterium]